MGTRTRTRRFPERTIQQVRLDSGRAMARARFCPDRSDVAHLRCVDDRPESDAIFGNQLWYFEGIGVDEDDRRQSVFGVVEYSIQFGLHELVEDGVFDTEYERERVRQIYDGARRMVWSHPAHRWLAAALILVTAFAFAVQLIWSLRA